MNDDVQIEFPCDYPIHVIGLGHATLREDVLSIVRAHAGEIDVSTVQVRPSRAGNYCSVRVTIVAAGEAQLKALHADLMADPRIRMVL